MIVSSTTLYLIGAAVVVFALASFVRGKVVAQRGGSGGAYRAVGTVLLAIAAIGVAYIGFGTKQVYVFYGSVEHGGIQHDKVVLIGSGSVSVHGGKSVAVPPVGDHNPENDVYLVNDTDRKLTVEVADYSSSKYSFLNSLGGGGDKNLDIAIGEVGSVRSVDNIGPADPPPDSVESETDFASRTWVSW